MPEYATTLGHMYIWLFLCVNFDTLFFRSFLNALLLLEREFQRYLAKQLENLQEKYFFSLV